MSASEEHTESPEAELSAPTESANAGERPRGPQPMEWVVRGGLLVLASPLVALSAQGNLRLAEYLFAAALCASLALLAIPAAAGEALLVRLPKLWQAALGGLALFAVLMGLAVFLCAQVLYAREAVQGRASADLVLDTLDLLSQVPALAFVQILGPAVFALALGSLLRSRGLTWGVLIPILFAGVAVFAGVFNVWASGGRNFRDSALWGIEFAIFVPFVGAAAARLAERPTPPDDVAA